MAPSKIVALPDKRLRGRSQKISTINEATSELAQRMKQATIQWEAGRPHELGVALAAPQIGIQKRIIIVRENFDDKDDRRFSVWVNPKIIKTLGEPVVSTEGCLSVPDIYGDVARYPKIKVGAFNLDGDPVRITAEGFLARVLQHEIDHLEGKLFIDHVIDNHFFILDSSGELRAIDREEQSKYSFLR